MKLYGLTGGIASGKSTVAKMLEEHGAKIIDADKVAREVVEPGQPALAEISARFPGVVKDGALDRKALGERIFNSEPERQALNAIIHPRVQGRVLELSQQYAEAGVRLVFYDVPLLFENGLEKTMEATVLVAVPPEVQLKRLQSRDGYDEAQAKARVAAQMSLDEKRKRATHVIDNGGTLEQTRRQVDALWNKLLT
ncbi:MAG: dephospho-CoA kinase [Myxococcaceae bacterium]